MDDQEICDICDKLNAELMQICHEMAYGDDSDKTFNRYCELQNIIFENDEKKQEYKNELFR